MATVTFDTLKAFHNLKAAGMSEAHAEAIVDCVAKAFSNTAATRDDLSELKAEIKTDLARLKTEILRAVGG